MLTAVLNTPEGLLEFELTDEQGTVVHEFQATQFTGNINLDLEAGSYHLEIRYEMKMEMFYRIRKLRQP